jgi:hypothetical protein
MPACVYVYVLDEAVPIPVGWAELLEAWEEGELKPFELVRGLVEGRLGRVRGVRLYGAYFKPETMTAVIEYVVDFEGRGSGTASVKLVRAEDPGRAIAEYYEAEKRGLTAREGRFP